MTRQLASGENVVLYNFVGGATNDVFTSPAHVMRRIASQVRYTVLIWTGELIVGCRIRVFCCCGMVWNGVLWCGWCALVRMVFCGWMGWWLSLVWCGVVWCGVIDMVW